MRTQRIKNIYSNTSVMGLEYLTINYSVLVYFKIPMNTYKNKENFNFQKSNYMNL